MPTIKETVNKYGEIIYSFQYFKGVNPITNKPVNTTYRGFTSKKDAVAHIKKLDYQKLNNTFEF